MSFGNLIDAMSEARLLVVGDVMLDEYIFGKATRISPEAPVMVMRHSRTELLPGGAANVAKNAIAFGARAQLVGIAGDDEGADLLEGALDRAGLEHRLLRDPKRKTTRKTRVVADSRHQVLRIDQEDESPAEELQDELFDVIQSQLDAAGAVVLSDYRKGCITDRLARQIHLAAKNAWKPLVVNAKPESLEFYRGATVITLNRAEAGAVLGSSVDAGNAEEAARALRESTRAEAMVITLGEDGMQVAGPECFRVLAPTVEVADPAGAGDTVVATIALGIAADGFRREVFELAAEAAACVVKHVGVATVTQADLAALRE